MKNNLFFICLLFLLGFNQLDAHDDPPCASLAQVQQNCNLDGTVTITFHVVNNTRCDSKGLTISDGNGFGQSYPINIGGQTGSNVTITYPGATPGELLCLDVILHGNGGKKEECCRTTICIRVDCCDLPGCCNMEAELYSTSDCEAADGSAWARFTVSGGTPPYTAAPGSYTQPTTGVIIMTGLSGGSNTFTFTDSEECEVEITIDMPENNMEAELHSTGGCGPNAWARFTVSGGTPPYTAAPGSYTQPTTGVIIMTGLSGGSNTFTFTDANGCEINKTVVIPGSGMQTEFQSTGGCGPNNRWVHVIVSGGTAPYTTPGTSIQPGFQGNFVVQQLSVGIQTLTFTDANGCEISITVNIPAGDCSQFQFPLNESLPSVTTITSEVSATIGVSMWGQCIPDMIEVFVNDELVLEMITGSGGCSDLDIQVGDYDTFCVEPCDEVEFVTTGDVCPGEWDCPGSTGTAFDITISCTLKDGDGSGGSRTREDVLIEAQSKINRELVVNQEATNLDVQQSLKVYPNPVTNELNITISDPMMEYQTARILNSAGQVVHIEKNSNLDQLQIETGAFPRGIYFIEITNNNGHKIVEKFMKLD